MENKIKKLSKLSITLIIVLVATMLTACNTTTKDNDAKNATLTGSSKNEPTTEATPTDSSKNEATSEAIPIGETTSGAVKYEDGKYKVGTEIPAGEYVIFADGALDGYVERSKDSNGYQSSIIASSSITTNIIITVKDGEYLTITNGYAVPIDDSTELDLTKGGMFKVGTHIDAGEYKIEVDDESVFGYAEVATDSSGDHTSVRISENIRTSLNITVNDGEYLTLIYCHIAK